MYAQEMFELKKKVPPHKALVGWVATSNYHVLLVEGKIEIKDMPLLFFTSGGGGPSHKWWVGGCGGGESSCTVQLWSKPEFVSTT